MTTYKMKKFRSNKDFYYDQHAKCQKQLKEEQDVYVYLNEKCKEAAVQMKCTEPRSYIIETQDGKIYIGEIETDCNLSNLKKHLLRYLTMKTTMSMMRIKLIMRSWK